MKRMRNSYFEALSNASLYLDDLERIIEIIKDELPQTAIRDKDYEYDSLEEMKEMNPARLPATVALLNFQEVRR